jgi:hypothetical protein
MLHAVSQTNLVAVSRCNMQHLRPDLTDTKVRLTVRARISGTVTVRVRVKGKAKVWVKVRVRVHAT